MLFTYTYSVSFSDGASGVRRLAEAPREGHRPPWSVLYNLRFELCQVLRQERVRRMEVHIGILRDLVGSVFSVRFLGLALLTLLAKIR